MIHINKDFDNPPSHLLGTTCKDKVEKALKEKNDHKPSSYSCRHNTVVKALRELYNNKCAYCETKVPKAGWDFEVEHYRSKKPPKNTPKHKGYYWLIYEWSNLIPICTKCNGAKSNHFPIEGKRVYTHPTKTAYFKANSTQLLAEKALIIHPEIDHPEQHLIFLANGSIKGLSNKGKETIAKCKLNRERLLIARGECIDDIREELEKIITEFTRNKNIRNTQLALYRIFDILLTRKDKTQKYSRLHYFLFLKFELFFIEKSDFSAPIKAFIKNTYREFLNNN